MRADEAHDPEDLQPPEAAALLKPNGIEPHLGTIRLALDVDVWRLVAIAGEEEEPVWADTEDGGHRSEASAES